MVSLIQVFMKKSQIVISILNFHHAIILSLANKAFHIVRSITSDNTSFENDIGKLKEYSWERNYPTRIIEEAVKKVSSMSMDDALKPTSRTKCQNIIPFVCIYNPSLPNIGKIVNQYWSLLSTPKVKV